MADNSETIIVKYVAEVEGLKAGLKSVQASVTELAKSNEELAKKLNDTFEKPIEKTKSLRAQLKELKAQLAEATDPKDIERLAKEAGKLSDQLQDAGDAAKVFASESKFEQVGTALGAVGGKLRNLDFKGAADQARLLASVVKSLSVTDIIQGVKDIGTTFLEVGKSLLVNPIFLIAAAIYAAVEAFGAVEEASKRVNEIFKTNAESVKKITDETNNLAKANRDLALQLDVLTGKTDETTAKRLANQNKFKDEYVKILNAQREEEKKLAEQTQKAREEDGFRQTKNLFEFLGGETDITKAHNVGLINIRSATQKQLAELKKNFAIQDQIITADVNNKEIEASKKASVSKVKIVEDEFKKLKETRDKALKEMGTLTPITISSQSAQSQEKTQKSLEDRLKKSQDEITKNFKSESDKRDAVAEASAKKQSDIDKAKKEILTESIQTANQLLDFYQESQQRKADEQVEIAQKEADAKNQTYKDQLDNNVISKKRYDQLVAKENKKLEAETIRIQKEAYERNKQIQIVQAIINGASAIINSLNSAPAPYNFILAALTGAAVAIQIATIENAPPPKFEKGGKVNGNRHYAGGTLIEAEKDEFIVNRKDALKHDKLLEAINNGRAEKYIHEMYLAPVLKQTAKRIREQQSKDFASNIANSMMLQNEFKDVNILDSLKMSRQNDKEIAHYIVKHINPNINKYNW